MRLHALEITAFGPFADTATVDFDELSSAGVFLLTGPTGAGKSSVLDAVCFALYGDVPGDRASAKRLRSDHAADGLAPRVRLECSLSGRRFRLTRTPGWERPKKRGSGTTKQQPGVAVSERIDGEWRPVTTRLDEAGHLVSHLLGMNLRQFTQVAMLPQGGFQAFLRARSDDRHRLLQQLFRTGRFEDVETWLRQRRSELTARARAQHQHLAELASRASETAGEALPGDWSTDAADDRSAAESLAVWVRHHLAALDTLAAQLGRAAAEARAIAATASTDLEAARVLADQQARHAAAAAERSALLARAEEAAALRSAVDAARRAASVAPLEQARVSTAMAHAEAQLRLAQLSDGLRDQALDDLSEEAVSARVAALTRELAAVEALLPAQRRLRRVLAEAARLEDQCAATEADRVALDEQRQRAPQRLAEAGAALEQARLDSAGADELDAEIALAQARRAAAHELDGLRAELIVAEQLRVEAVEAAHAAKERWLHLQELRITGMAAELAGGLAVGGCCPVCGSAEHPAPAQPLPGAPDEAASRAARHLLDDAESLRHAREQAVRDLQTRRALAEQTTSGRSAADAEAELAGLEERAVSLRATAARVPQLARAVADLRHDEETGARRRAELDLAHTRAATALAALTTQADEITAQLADALGDVTTTSLDTRRRQLDRGLTRLRELAAAARARQETGAALELAEQRLAAAAGSVGFSTARAALDAVLPEAELDAAQVALFAHDSGLAAAEQLLADPALRAASGRPSPDLPALVRAEQQAASALVDTESAARAADARRRRFGELGAELLTDLAAAAPLRDELVLATSLSLFVDGRSPDNRLQMRLSAYVLAARLGQVVAAANERLATMSDRRFTLEHTGRRGAGETRGGLSLLVRDEWTGETRDPVTLSGGETFVVSLALALGLADVVTLESGAASLDTLFVDEGFGALDADTLDDVLDTLDSLRDGGRVVGVVSHVPQMRERIPTHLDARKGRRGSSLALTRG